MVDADNRDVPANFGDVRVLGQSGSSASISADSTAPRTNGAAMQVGDYFFDTTPTRDNEYTAGVLSGQTITPSRTGTGGVQVSLRRPDRL